MRSKRVAIICEFSGVVRQAMREEGHDAWSFDILPAEDGSPYHVQGDVLEHDFTGWDLAICHPPCTNLSVSGARFYRRKLKKDPQCIYNSAAFAFKLWNLPIPQLALENPISTLSNWAKPTQIIQPWMFGEFELKATCLWLRGLPRLEPTIIIPPEMRDTDGRVHWESPGPDRWARRSRTLYGIGLAMARQWGSFDL